MKRVIAASAVIATSVVGLGFIQSPASAQSGDFESSVFYQDLSGVSRGTINDRCGCTPFNDQVDGDDIDSSYKADNASFAWDVTFVIIHYHWNGSAWVARNNGPGWPSGTGKARVGNLPCNPQCGSRVNNSVTYTG